MTEQEEPAKVNGARKMAQPPDSHGHGGADPREWTVEEVCRWVRTDPKLEDLVPIVRTHSLDGHVLLNYITNVVLRDELGITAFGKRVRFLEALEALKWTVGIVNRGRRERIEHASRKNAYANNGLNKQHGTNYKSVIVNSHTSQSAPNTGFIDRIKPTSATLSERGEREYGVIRENSTTSEWADGKYQCHSRERESESNTPEKSYSSPEYYEDMGSNYNGHGSSMLVNENSHDKRAASRIADAEKKRIKRQELKKDPAAYALYLQKERERNARRRARMREEKEARLSSLGTNSIFKIMSDNLPLYNAVETPNGGYASHDMKQEDEESGVALSNNNDDTPSNTEKSSPKDSTKQNSSSPMGVSRITDPSKRRLSDALGEAGVDTNQASTSPSIENLDIHSIKKKIRIVPSSTEHPGFKKESFLTDGADQNTSSTPN
ncbi:hypothetical protein AX774_g2117 [Zancudomyces culisetae]|uniref:SAM domain-containing protein n=1 Tax=Zancudomyces culisetae TaxID=1213189 RepID=A0A1R1PTS2_ZANCU|nr:hypothetical protein AX774_g2117 [Zancudomyces culisetae]|eukprot:OMH84360.1 hypothetical protein AX774_g2117 [Zancudomyces culisetae]